MCEVIFKLLYCFVISFALIISLDNITHNLVKKYYFTSSVLFSVVIFLFFNFYKIQIGLILSVVLMCFLCYINCTKKLYSVFVSLISSLICLLSYFICGFIVDILSKKQEEVTNVLSISFGLTIISAFFLSIMISYILKEMFRLLKIDNNIFNSNSTNKIFVIVIFIIVAITAITDGFIFLVIGNMNNLTVVLTFRNVSRLIILLNILFVFLFLGFNIALLYFNNKNYERNIKKQFNENEIAQLKEYTGMIESLSDDLRRFRHDYFNIMEIIKSYIENDNLNGLKEFYQSELIPESEKLKKNNKSIYMLKNLKIDSLKGLISSKIIKAQGMQIETHVEILDDIKDIKMSEIDLCRMIGVFLDNAIEACEGLEKPYINMYIIDKEASHVIVINNKCSKDTPPVYKIFEKGFSSKGKNRGLGLSNVKRIIDEKYDNVYLSTKIKDCIFTEEIIIKKC